MECSPIIQSTSASTMLCEQGYRESPILMKKRDKYKLNKSPRSYPPATPIRGIKTDPHFRSAYHRIPTTAKIVSFKQESERPELDSAYDPSCPTSYLYQCFNNRKKIGTGCFGVVVSVTSKENSKQYAIKYSNRQYLSSGDRRLKLREVQKNELLFPHPNIVRFFKAWEENNVLYLQTELCKCSMNDVIRRDHELKGKNLWQPFNDMLLALKYIHSYDLIHLDIKPENIFRGYDDSWKLGDFGLASEEKDFMKRSADDGDARYLAQEVLNKLPTKLADVFSLGISFFEVATDVDLPMDGDQWEKLRSGRPFSRELVAGVDPQFIEIIQKMMSPIPDQRPHAAQLLELKIIKENFTKKQRKTFEKYGTPLFEPTRIKVLSSPVTSPYVKRVCLEGDKMDLDGSYNFSPFDTADFKTSRYSFPLSRYRESGRLFVPGRLNFSPSPSPSREQSPSRICASSNAGSSNSTAILLSSRQRKRERNH